MATLRKRKKKEGGYVYFIDFYFNDRRHRISTKTDNLHTANLILKDIEARISKGTFQVEDVQPEKKVYFKDFIREYLEYSKSRKAEATWRADKRALKALYGICGNRTLASIDKKLIDRFLGDRVKKLRKTSVNIDLRHIKASLSKAVDWGYINENPAKGIRPLPVPTSAPRFFTETQLSLILGAIDFDPLKEIMIFAVNTGVRIGELINIKWTDVDFAGMRVRISHKEDFRTKSGRERTIPLNEAAYDVLSRLERKGEYVFCRWDGEKRDKHFISRRFKKCLRKVDLGEGFSFHSLRHTFASHLVQKGVSLYIVSKLLGHSNLKTTEIYAHLAPEKYHDVVGLLSSKGESEVLNMRIKRA